MEEGMRKAKTIQKNVVLVIFLVAALGILASAIGDIIGGKELVNKSSKTDETYATVTATISDIESEKRGDDYRHTVYVTFTYEGQVYENVMLNSYSSSMYIGEEIEILCDKEHPETIKSATTTQFITIFMIGFAGGKILMSVIILIIVISNLVKTNKKDEPVSDPEMNVSAKGIKLKYSSRNRKGFIAVFGIVSAVLISFGLILFIKGLNAGQNAEKVRAQVVEYERYRDSDGDRHTRIYVSYEYNGKVYERVRLLNSPSEEEGAWVDIYVNPEDPSDISVSKVPYQWLIVTGVGLFMLLFVVPDTGSMIKKKRNRKEIQEHGITIWAEVEDVSLDNSIRVNGKRPYQLYCGYQDSVTGERQYFVSESVWNDLTYLFTPGDQVIVHVMPENYSRYYLSLEENISRKGN